MAHPNKNTSNGKKPEVKKPEVKKPKMIDHVVTEEDIQNNPDLLVNGVKVGDTIQIPDPGQKKADKNQLTVSKEIKEVFEKHPHVLTIWANEDQSIWYFRPKPGFTPIERNEL